MSHEIEQAYRDVKPPEALIATTLEKVKKQQFRQSVILLVSQCCISAAVCTVLAFALEAYAVCALLFITLCLIFAAVFYKKNTSYLEEKVMSDNKAKLTDSSLEAVVGGIREVTDDMANRLEDSVLISEVAGSCSSCGKNIPGRDMSAPCPSCGHINEHTPFNR